MEEKADGNRRTRHPKALVFEREGVGTLGRDAFKAVSTAFLWALVMLGLGAGVWLLFYVTGLLHKESPAWSVLVWVLLPGYMVTGAAVGAYLGAVKGLGGAMLHIGVEKGMVIYLLERTMDKIEELVQRSPETARAVDRAQERIENLPLKEWETRLEQAVDLLLHQEDATMDPAKGRSRRKVIQKVRAYFYQKIERYLLAIVRQEPDEEGGGGGVSMAKVRAKALERAESSYERSIKRMFKVKLRLALIGLLLVYSIAPLMATFL